MKDRENPSYAAAYDKIVEKIYNAAINNNILLAPKEVQLMLRVLTNLPMSFNDLYLSGGLIGK